MSEPVEEVEGDGEGEEELEGEDDGAPQLEGLELRQGGGEVARHDENSEGGQGEVAGLHDARDPVADGQHAGQLGLVDGQVGRHGPVELL